MMNNNNDVRCYELSSKMNKTFKVSRMGNVILLDLEWGNEAKHRQMFTDLFMFSGDERLPVRLKLDRLAYSLMIEEYPKSAEFIVELPDETDNNEGKAPKYWLLSMDWQATWVLPVLSWDCTAISRLSTVLIFKIS